METLKTFDFNLVSLIVGNNLIQGFQQDTAIKVTANEDDFEHQTGADGNVLRWRKRDATAELEITLQPSSNSNDLLAAQRALDLASGQGVVAVQLKQLNGTLLVNCPNGYIKKNPDIEMGQESKPRTWRLSLPTPQIFAGGQVT